MDEENIDLRSEEVKEILGRTPPWLVRWGMLFVFVFLVVALWLLYRLPYPETVDAEVRVRRSAGDVELFTIQQGRIESIFRQEDTVNIGDVVLILKSQGSHSDIMQFDTLINSIDERNDSMLLQMSFPKYLDLGELEAPFVAFKRKLAEIKGSGERGVNNRTLVTIKRDLKREESKLSAERRRKQSLEEESRDIYEIYIRESNLRQTGRGDYNDYRTAKANKSQWERYIQEANANISIIRANISAFKEEMNYLAISSEEAREGSMSQLRGELNRLRLNVDNWKRNYLVRTPIDGVVTFDDINVNQYVTPNNRLGVVVPVGASDLIGKAELPLKNTGKVKENQKVIIDFYHFPAREFGAVEGYVSKISKIPTKTKNLLGVEVHFPNGLITNEGHNLDLTQKLSGDMVIVVEEKRLIEWLLERI